MVHRGPRPAHRKGTVGRPWRRFRKNTVDGVTHCQNPTCGELLVRDAPCTHPNHQRLGYCPTHPRYPTLEHPHRLVDGGEVRSGGNAQVWCYSCNSRGGRSKAVRGDPGPSRHW